MVKRVRALQITKRQALLVIAGFVLLGGILWVTTRAAGPFTAAEPESGTMSSAVTKMTDSNASGGAAAKFGSGYPELGFTIMTENLPASARPAHLQRLAAIGTKWMRAGFYASDYGLSDSFVDASTKAGVNVLLTGALFAEQWAGTKPVDVEGFSTHMATLASRYQGKGPGGANPVLELPNESNGRMDPKVYAQLACASYAKVKAVNPSIKIIGASENVYVPTWTTWLHDVYKNGFSKCIDGISFHNYDDPNTDPNNKFRQLRAIMTQYGDGNKEVWLTEFGATTCPGPPYLPLGCYTEQGQADKLVKVIKDIKATYPWIPVVMVYGDRDIPSLYNSNPHEAYFGVWHADGTGGPGTPKPAAAALKQLYGL